MRRILISAVLCSPGVLTVPAWGQSDPPPCTDIPSTDEQSIGAYPDLVVGRRDRLNVNGNTFGDSGDRVEAPAETHPKILRGEGDTVESVTLAPVRLGSLTVVHVRQVRPFNAPRCTQRRPTTFSVVTGQALASTALTPTERKRNGLLKWRCEHLTAATPTSVVMKYELAPDGRQPKALGKRSRTTTATISDPCGSNGVKHTGSLRSIGIEPGTTPGFTAEEPGPGLATLSLEPPARKGKKAPVGPPLIRVKAQLRVGSRTLATRTYCGVYLISRSNGDGPWRMTALRPRCPTR